jgi:hypothetical protein
MLTKLLLKHIAFVSFLRLFFVPHHGNNHRPHFFKEHVMLSLLIGSLLLLFISFTSYRVLHTTAFGNNVISSVLIDLTNQIRKDHGLPLVSESIRLDQASFLKAHDMKTNHYFAHNAPNGTEPWYWFDVVGYPFLYAGENLGLNFKNSYDVQKAWLSSKKHRDNILDPHYQHIGIAVIESDRSLPPTRFIVQMFGTPTAQLEETPYRTQGHWYEFLLFNISYYIHTLYITLLGVLIGMLFLMIVIEIRKQHIRHIIYGILLLIIISLCETLNSFLL